MWTDDPALLDLLPHRAQPELMERERPLRVVERSYSHAPGTLAHLTAPLTVTIGHMRPANLEDARRLLEGQGV